MSTVNDLLKVAEQIGGINDSNSHFVEGLARRIDEAEYYLEDLKVSELCALIEQHREFYNHSLSGDIKPNSAKKISIDEVLACQNRERGFDFMPLEPDLLISRVKAGGSSGRFLAAGFFSAYRTGTPFQHSLGEIVRLDTEAIRLFHQILHIRFIKGWSDDELYEIEQAIKAISTNHKKKPR